MLSLFDYLGRAAGKQLGLEVAICAKQQKTQIGTRQVSNPIYSGTVNLYTKDFLLSFFSNLNYSKLIKEDKEWYKNKTKNKIENDLPF